MWNCVEIYLIYRVDEGLGIVSRKASDHLDIFTVREDGCYQTNRCFHGKRVAGQPFPGREVTTHEDIVKLTDRQLLE